jgi:hypothetical protein
MTPPPLLRGGCPALPDKIAKSFPESIAFSAAHFGVYRNKKQIVRRLDAA